MVFYNSSCGGSAKNIMSHWATMFTVYQGNVADTRQHCGHPGNTYTRSVPGSYYTGGGGGTKACAVTDDMIGAVRV